MLIGGTGAVRVETDLVAGLMCMAPDPSSEELLAENARLRDLVAELQGTVTTLQSKITELERMIGRNSGSSSKPQSTDPPNERRRQAEAHLDTGRLATVGRLVFVAVESGGHRVGQGGPPKKAARRSARPEGHPGDGVGLGFDLEDHLDQVSGSHTASMTVASGARIGVPPPTFGGPTPNF